MKALIDASVILAVLGSRTGGSAKVLQCAQKSIVKAYISEAIFEEIMRNKDKVGASAH